jgi:phosphoglycolate phosphatase
MHQDNSNAHASDYVLLFDIDGTLIDSGGAGGRALVRAARECFRNDRIDRVAFHGRTDRGIMAEMLERAGIEASTENLHQLAQQYFLVLPDELQLQSGRVLPGVVNLLNALKHLPGCHLGLLTGNMQASARMKLEHYGLWDYFQFGIYGHASTVRRELAQPAWETIQQRVSPRRENVSVIGDTPMDVELALAMQVRCLAVCTGGCTADDLRTAGADFVTDDLSDTQQVARWLVPALA